MKAKTAIIVLNGKGFDKISFASELKNEPVLIIAADGGIKYLEDFLLPPVIHIGDMDSSAPNLKVPVKDTIIYQADKNFSDFHLALEYAQKKKVSQVLVFAAAGGRVDHFLSNYETAVRFTEIGLKITFIGRTENIYFICSSAKFSFPRKSTVSVFSCAAITENVTLKGFKYPFTNSEMKKSFPVGLSNVTISDRQFVSFKSGVLAVIFNKKKI